MHSFAPRALVAALAVLLVAGTARSHCEIPCGIYGDRMRIDILHEHVTTIEKSMQQIAALSGKTDAQSQNQLVRWIANKDEHAVALQHVVTQYFMTQRVKPADPKDDAATKKYVAQLKPLHGMLVAAMKCKQTVDVAHCAALRECIDAFAAAYFSKEDLEHIRKDHGKHGE